jgi:hypothetical protein
VDAIRRLVPRAEPSEQRPTPRRVPVPEGQAPRLRGRDRNMAEALQQLQAGVPLNWGQIEDDPELATLARLQEAGEQARTMRLREPDAEFKAALVERLAARLPAPKNVPAEPAAPKSMAGFSERVQVLTQVEENLSLTTDWRKVILRGAVVVAALVLLVWGLSAFVQAATTPTFTWIEIRRSGETFNRLERPSEWALLACREERVRNRTRPLNFEFVRSLGEARDYTGYPIPTLPESITVPTTYTIQLAVSAVDPCDGNDLTEGDEGALVKLQYATTYRQFEQGGPRGGRSLVSQVSLFAGYLQPTDVDVTTGEWHEVRVGGDIHGVYWRGGPYRDRSGAQWLGEVNVLTVERDNMVVTLVGSPAEGANEEMLLELVRNMRW